MFLIPVIFIVKLMGNDEMDDFDKGLYIVLLSMLVIIGAVGSFVNLVSMIGWAISPSVSAIRIILGMLGGS